MADGAEALTRSERRRQQTRAALIEAAQRLITDGRQSAAVLEITKLADVGLGSFYNHFATKEELYRAALEDVLERLGTVLDALTADIEDPAEAFAQRFRLTGRLFRLHPRLTGVLLRSGPGPLHADTGLAPRARRDIAAAAAQGRFAVTDVDLAAALAAGAVIGLGTLLEKQPDRDDARATDELTESLLRAYGIPAAEAAALSRLPLPPLSA